MPFFDRTSPQFAGLSRFKAKREEDERQPNTFPTLEIELSAASPQIHHDPSARRQQLASKDDATAKMEVWFQRT